MNTKSAPANTPAGGFTYRLNPRTNKWNVFEDGKFRRPFDTEQAVQEFIAGELAKKSKKGKSHA